MKRPEALPGRGSVASPRGAMPGASASAPASVRRADLRRHGDVGGVRVEGFVRGQERDVEYGNRMQESYDQKRAAKGYGSASRFALLGGFAQAGPSLFDMYQRVK